MTRREVLDGRCLTGGSRLDDSIARSTSLCCRTFHPRPSFVDEPSCLLPTSLGDSVMLVSTLERPPNRAKVSRVGGRGCKIDSTVRSVVTRSTPVLCIRDSQDFRASEAEGWARMASFGIYRSRSTACSRCGGRSQIEMSCSVRISGDTRLPRHSAPVLGDAGLWTTQQIASHQTSRQGEFDVSNSFPTISLTFAAVQQAAAGRLRKSQALETADTGARATPSIPRDYQVPHLDDDGCETSMSEPPLSLSCRGRVVRNSLPVRFE